MQKKNSKSPHRSFHRTYREEILDNFEAPSLTSLAGETFSIIFKNWKIFGSIILLLTFFMVLLVGLLSESNISEMKSTIESSTSELFSGNIGSFAKSGLLLISTLSTAGLSSSLSTGRSFILIFLFLIIFLFSTYYTRHFLAKKSISLRETLYNSMTPLVSSFLIFLLVLIELIPILLAIIISKIAVSTEFLENPFYAMLFLIFITLMFILSLYLISGTLIAFVASSAPGIYPLDALRSSKELIFGRRIKFLIRLLFSIVIISMIFVVVMLPVIIIDNWLKSIFDFLISVPAISFFLLLTTCFSFAYVSIYLYLFYRKLLNFETKN